MTSDTSAPAGAQHLEFASDISGTGRGETIPGVRRRSGAAATVLPEPFAGVFADYQANLTKPGGPLDADSVRVYCSRVRQYLAWLAGGMVDGDPLTDPDARDWAARDYRRHLQAVAKRKPSTINAHLTAVDDFYRRRGLGPARVKRAEISQAAPRALGKRDQLRLLREVDRVPSLRDKAIAYTAFYAGTRIAETVALDVADVAMSARRGHLVIRYGKNGKYRQVPLHPKLRAVLEDWLTERAKKWTGAATEPALFLNRRGGRLSTRSAYTVLRAIAEAANLPVGREEVFTPHVLRHTAGTTMTREGTDIVIVAELLGHSVETARRYSLPTLEDRRKAIERLTVDE